MKPRSESVAVFLPALRRRLRPAGFFADAVVLGLRATLRHPGIAGPLGMVVAAMMMAGLRAGIAARGGLTVVTLVATLPTRIGRRPFAAWAVIFRAGLLVTVWFAIVAVVHFRPAFAVLLSATFGPEIGSARFAAITIRAAFAVPFWTRGLAAWAGIRGARRTLIALALASLATFGAPRLAFVGAAEFIGADFAVAVAVELAQHIGGAIRFLVIDHAIVIGIERAEESGHRALGVFTSRRAFARRGVRRAGWRCVFLSRQRPRGQREGEGGDKEMSGFHGGWVLG